MQKHKQHYPPQQCHANTNMAKSDRRQVTKQQSGGKRLLVKQIQQNSMKMLSITSQAILVKAPTNPYHAYHLQITSDYYKQKWVVCKRYSEIYRLRKSILDRLKAHKKTLSCRFCSQLHQQLSQYDFPPRVHLRKITEADLVNSRTAGLEDFIIALCQFLSNDETQFSCREITQIRKQVKEYLQFPLEHENQHIRAICALQYIDTKEFDVKSIDTEACPICLSEWDERNQEEQLVVSACRHFFHEQCINEWYTSRFDCPMCRTIAGEGE